MSLIHCHSSTQILLKQGYANHHKKFKQCHGVIINMRRKQLHAPSQQYMVPSALSIASMMPLCSIASHKCVSALTMIHCELSCLQLKIGESAVEQGNYLEVCVIRMSCGHLADYNLLQNKVHATDVVI